MTKLSNPNKRSTEEWIGLTPDTPAPSYVKLRVYERYGGFCHIAKRKIAAGEPWDIDHVEALCNGGENRENNLAPALRDKHKGKTAKDRAIKAKTDKQKKSHLGIRKTQGRPMPGTKRSRFKKGFDGIVRIRIDDSVVWDVNKPDEAT